MRGVLQTAPCMCCPWLLWLTRTPFYWKGITATALDYVPNKAGNEIFSSSSLRGTETKFSRSQAAYQFKNSIYMMSDNFPPVFARFIIVLTGVGALHLPSKTSATVTAAHYILQGWNITSLP